MRSASPSSDRAGNATTPGTKKPALAEALENAFDPAANTNCIGLEQAARDSAAAWLPPGMAYDGDVDDGDSADHPDADNAGTIDRRAEIDIASSDLPSFLTEDEPVAAALNGASAP